MPPPARSTPESGSTNLYFSDEDPELITSTGRFVLSAMADTLRLDCRDRNGVDDVFDERTAG